MVITIDGADDPSAGQHGVAFRREPVVRVIDKGH